MNTAEMGKKSVEIKAVSYHCKSRSLWRKQTRNMSREFSKRGSYSGQSQHELIIKWTNQKSNAWGVGFSMTLEQEWVGILSNHWSDGSDVTWKMHSHSFVAIIPACSSCQMQANFPGAEFLRSTSKLEGERQFRLSVCVLGKISH